MRLARRRRRRADARHRSTSPAMTAARAGLAGRGRARAAAAARHQRAREHAPRRARSPTASTAATPSTACARRSCSASAASAPWPRCGIEPEVFHMNEGHAGFLGARARAAAGGGGRASTPSAAFELVRAGDGLHDPHARAGRHRPLPARAHRALLRPRRAVDIGPGVDSDPAPRRGAGGDGEVFNMAVLGLRSAQRAQRRVAPARRRCRARCSADLWPGFEVDEVPIGHITNGVHARTWVEPRLRGALRAHARRRTTRSRRVLGPAARRCRRGAVGRPPTGPRAGSSTRSASGCATSGSTAATSRHQLAGSTRALRSRGADDRLRAARPVLQAPDADPARARAARAPAERRRAAGAARRRRQGAPRRRGRQGR